MAALFKFLGLFVQGGSSSSLAPYFLQTTTTTTTIFICTLALNDYYKIILQIKLEYWLPGITIGASGARQPKLEHDSLGKVIFFNLILGQATTKENSPKLILR